MLIELPSLAFWLVGPFVVSVGYSYVGYPVLLRAFGAFRPKPGDEDRSYEWPPVSITLPVYNEEANLRRTLERLLAIDYPRDRLQIIVISDASTDGTDSIAVEFADRGVELVRLAERGGKTAAENSVRHRLLGEIIVNTDATTTIDKDGLKPLIAAFRDPTVGVASGRDVSVSRPGGSGGLGERGYVGYEMWVRGLETNLGGIVGASGCFYAARRELHGELVPEALSRDFAAPLIAKERGYRSISVSNAICYVPRTESVRVEHARKVRTMTRGLETLYYKRHLLNPARYGLLFPWMLFSHKLVRWFVPLTMPFAALGLVLLSIDAVWIRWMVGAGLAAGAVAMIGWRWPAEKTLPRLVAICTYGVSGLVAGMKAWIKAMRRELNPIWEPTRRH